jgi:uncharacterized protein YgiM (DUF1202 family)
MSTKQLLLLSLALCCIASLALAAAEKTMSVQNRKAELRDTPSPFGKIVASLSYGDKVTVADQNGPWVKVSTPGSSGWVHSTALTTKTVVMKAGDGAETGASSGEIALAGKGFNADIESQFKSTHKEADFKSVDKMEKITIPSARIKAFVDEGGLAASSKGGVQ